MTGIAGSPADRVLLQLAERFDHEAEQDGQIAENRADQHHLRRRFVPDSPPEESGFAVSVVLPASGCEMIAKVRRRAISSVSVLIHQL